MATAQRTDPELWDDVKSQLEASSKGGEKGEWSARKAQLAVQEYKRRGGGYKGRKSRNNDLQAWTKENWGTRSGKPSRKTGERYLPEAAREELSEEEYARTTKKKRADTRNGKQHSPQPDDVAAKTAKHRSNGADDPNVKDLAAKARELDIEGRSKMSRDELAEAIAAEEARRERRDAVTKRELMEAAMVLGVQRRSTKSKDELRTEIANAVIADAGEARTKAELQDIAKTLNVTNVRSLTKAKLREAVHQAAI